MSANIDLYWSFRSPYSYLAMPGALDVVARYDVEMQFRPVLPLAVRKPEFFDPDNHKKLMYLGVDIPRRAEMLGMHLSWPSPDPVVQDMETFTMAEEQPYIYRLVYLGVEAQRRGRGIQFAYEISQLLFGATEDWNQGNHLKDAAARAGLDLASMDTAIADRLRTRTRKRARVFAFLVPPAPLSRRVEASAVTHPDIISAHPFASPRRLPPSWPPVPLRGVGWVTPEGDVIH